MPSLPRRGYLLLTVWHWSWRWSGQRRWRRWWRLPPPWLPPPDGMALELALEWAAAVAADPQTDCGLPFPPKPQPLSDSRNR